MDPSRLLGDAEVWVDGGDQVWFAAPSLVYHYVVTHKYQPPKEFVRAILEGKPLTDTEVETTIVRWWLTAPGQ